MGLIVINSAQRILNINTEYGTYNSDTTHQWMTFPFNGYIKYIAMSRGPGNNQQYFSIYNEDTTTTYSNIFSIGNQDTVAYQSYGATDIPFNSLERLRIIQENAGTQGKPISNTTFYIELPSINSNTISFIGSMNIESDTKTHFLIGNNPYSFGAGSLNTSGSSINSLGFTMPYATANLVGISFTATESGGALTSDTQLNIIQNGTTVTTVTIATANYANSRVPVVPIAFSSTDRIEFICASNNSLITSSTVLAIFEIVNII